MKSLKGNQYVCFLLFIHRYDGAIEMLNFFSIISVTKKLAAFYLMTFSKQQKTHWFCLGESYLGIYLTGPFITQVDKCMSRGQYLQGLPCFAFTLSENFQISQCFTSDKAKVKHQAGLQYFVQFSIHEIFKTFIIFSKIFTQKC